MTRMDELNVRFEGGLFASSGKKGEQLTFLFAGTFI